MSNVLSMLTGSTCGDACWHAKEDVCHCSCGGKNHGCMVEANGERPLRTAKINGKFHTLKAVGLQGNVHHEAVAINEAAGITFVFADSARDMDAPAKTRKASASQIARWPELSQYRELDKLPSYEQYRNAPYLLWVKQI